MLNEIQNKEKIIIKENFKKHFSKLTNYDLFMKYSLSYLRRAIRVNTLKISVENFKKRLSEDWILEQVPWCKEGFWIKHKEGRRDIGNLPEHQLGYFYVQEPASMIPPIVLDPKPGEFVLDMCASPGSKTTQLAQYMQNKGLIIANDYKGIRMKPLGLNIQRLGITNVVLTVMRGTSFFNKGFLFDKILVDAPCSGTGTIRKSLKTLQIWNPNMTKKLSYDQKKLLETAFNILKPNGTIVYSTCSVEPIENENVVSWLLEKYANAYLEEIDLNIKRTEAIKEFENLKFNKEINKTLRIWPQDNDTEGFFVAKIKKSDENV
jgi:tRNA (cytosine49-C5)-methyltransferase